MEICETLGVSTYFFTNLCPPRLRPLPPLWRGPQNPKSGRFFRFQFFLIQTLIDLEVKARSKSFQIY